MLSHLNDTHAGGLLWIFSLNSEQTAIFGMAYEFGQEHIAPFARD